MTKKTTKKKPLAVKPPLRQGKEQAYLQTLRCIRDEAHDWLELPPSQQTAIGKGLALIQGIFAVADKAVKQS